MRVLHLSFGCVYHIQTDAFILCVFGSVSCAAAASTFGLSYIPKAPALISVIFQAGFLRLPAGFSVPLCEFSLSFFTVFSFCLQVQHKQRASAGGFRLCSCFQSHKISDEIPHTRQFWSCEAFLAEFGKRYLVFDHITRKKHLCYLNHMIKCKWINCNEIHCFLDAPLPVIFEHLQFFKLQRLTFSSANHQLCTFMTQRCG